MQKTIEAQQQIIANLQNSLDSATNQLLSLNRQLNK